MESQTYTDMADRRKGQEIERTLRRVDEAVADFSASIGKAQEAGCQSHRDKLESDLRKDLKKLQRHREMIKCWQSSPDVKEKAPLEEARKKIDKEIEAFKAYEKESKSKFGRAGPSSRPKSEANEAERERNRKAIRNAYDIISKACGKCEGAKEALLAKKAGRTKPEKERLAKLEETMNEHEKQLENLEALLRGVDTDNFPEPEALKEFLKGVTVEAADDDSGEGRISDDSSQAESSAHCREAAAPGCPPEDAMPLCEGSSLRDLEAGLERQLAECVRACEASENYMPSPTDSRLRLSYKPRSPWNCEPPSFPCMPLQCWDSPRFIRSLEADCLFFMFFFQPGTYQQYLAATELKQGGWRYHMGEKTWFQRAETPKATADLHETGSFFYFDFQSNWIPRVKTDFTFHYAQLEDELVLPDDDAES